MHMPTKFLIYPPKVLVLDTVLISTFLNNGYISEPWALVAHSLLFMCFYIRIQSIFFSIFQPYAALDLPYKKLSQWDLDESRIVTSIRAMFLFVLLCFKKLANACISAFY